jgi:hypothetical protein
VGKPGASHPLRSATPAVKGHIDCNKLSRIFFIDVSIHLQRPVLIYPNLHHAPTKLFLHLHNMAERTRTQESADIFDTTFVAAPRTEVLMDEDGPGATERRLHKLQHTKSGDDHILLVPQPSLIDLNDPLRWSALKKWTVLANGVAYAFK